MIGKGLMENYSKKIPRGTISDYLVVYYFGKIIPSGRTGMWYTHFVRKEFLKTAYNTFLKTATLLTRGFFIYGSSKTDV